MTNQEEKATKLEEQVKALKEELEICMEAKSTSEACEALLDFANVKSAEPFSTTHDEPNEWHKNPGGGGGCFIL